MNLRVKCLGMFNKSSLIFICEGLKICFAKHTQHNDITNYGAIPDKSHTVQWRIQELTGGGGGGWYVDFSQECIHTTAYYML